MPAQVSRCAICDFLGTWDKYGKPSPGGLWEGGVVLIGGGNENWGMFSEHVEDRSVAWGKFDNKLKVTPGFPGKRWRRVAVAGGEGAHRESPCAWRGARALATGAL